MKRRVALAVFALFVLSATALAEDVTGKWKVTATSAYGEEYNLDLVLEQTDGALTGTLSTPEGDVKLEKLVFTDPTLRFEVWVAGSSYTVKMDLADHQLSGTFEGGGDSGRIVAKRP